MIVLSGAMNSGKTTFVTSMLEGTGYEGVVTSWEEMAGGAKGLDRQVAIFEGMVKLHQKYARRKVVLDRSVLDVVAGTWLWDSALAEEMLSMVAALPVPELCVVVKPVWPGDYLAEGPKRRAFYEGVGSDVWDTATMLHNLIVLWAKKLVWNYRVLPGRFTWQKILLKEMCGEDTES